VKPAVGDAETLLGVAEVELAHRRQQSGGSREGTEQLGELLADQRVRQAGSGNHVEDALPDLVEPVHAGLPASLAESLQLGWRAAEHQRGHGRKRSVAVDRPSSICAVRRIGLPMVSDARRR
jgi:hypothetical protein